MGLALVALVVGVALGIALMMVLRGRPDPASSGRTTVSPEEDQSHRLAEEALATLPIGVVVADERGQAVYRNRFAQQFHGGRHSDAFVESAVNDLLGLESDELLIEREIEVYGPPRRNLLLRRVMVATDDVSIGMMVTVEDVTERHRVEAIRRDFVANVSHELKTPVGAMAILAETLSQSTDPAVTGRLADRLQAETLRVGMLIDDLLALSRIESGERFEEEHLVVADLVQTVVDQIGAHADRRDVWVETVPIDPELAVRGDGRQLVSALSNLVDNAMKYSDDGSQVVISAHQQDRRVVLDVRDAGVGIPEADLDRVFERFYRVDPGRSRDTGGTGLGLSIVRRVALNHGGDVRVDSTEGVGSTFSLFLPAAPERADDHDDRTANEGAMH